MTDPKTVTWTLWVVYTIYAIAIMSLVAWFGYKVQKKPGEKSKGISAKAFYTYLALLVVIGVGLHILTYNQLPWVAWELKRHKIAPEQVVNITIKDHKFILPEKPIKIQCNKVVKFVVRSEDLTYGFGLFRKDQSMIFQMQVVPKYNNEILWKFTKNGTYTIRSTEYSGPKGAFMDVEDAVVVEGCKEDDIHSK